MSCPLLHTTPIVIPFRSCPFKCQSNEEICSSKMMPVSARKPPVEEAQRIQLLCIVHPLLRKRREITFPTKLPSLLLAKITIWKRRLGKAGSYNNLLSHINPPQPGKKKKRHFHEIRGVCGIKAPAAGEGGGGRPPPSTFLGRRHSLVAAHQAPAPSPLPERGGFLPAAVPLPGAAYLPEDETGGSCAAIGSLQSAPPGGRASASLEAGGSNSGDGAERSGRQRQ